MSRTPPRDASAAAPSFWLGIACGLGTSLIWGVQSVVSRQSVADGLTAADVTILRFVTAALILLPFAFRRMRPFPVGSLGWPRALLLTALVGAPYSLVLVGGAHFAPALHSAVVAPGLIPLLTAVAALVFFGERPGPLRLLGLGLVLVGLAAFSWQALGEIGRSGGGLVWVGDALFALNAVLWTAFGLLARHWKAEPLQVTVATCLLSLALLPLFVVLLPVNLGAVAWPAILLQAVYQGGLTGVLALFLYAKTVELIGAGRATLFLPLNPLIAAVAAALLLGERPTALEAIGMVVAVAGMTVALRAPSRA